MKSFTLLYDKLVKGKPLRNLTNDTESNTYRHFSSMDIKMSVISTWSYRKPYKNPIYPLDIDGLEFDSIVDKIPEITKKILDHYKIPIVIYWAHEGLSLEKYDYWLEKISYHFGKSGFQNNKKYIISGNLKIEKSYANLNIEELVIKESNKFKKYQEFLKYRQLGKMDKCFSLNFWEEEWQIGYKLNNDLGQSLLPFFNYNNKVANYLFYNNKIRPHRMALLAEIYRLNLQKGAYISCGQSLDDVNDIDSFINSSVEFFNETSVSKIYFKNFIENLKPMRILDEVVNFNQLKGFSFADNHYLHSWFSIVSETDFSNTALFMSEKVWKPMVYLQPFVIWGSPGTLQYLNDRGYRTFHNIFDESYDLELDPEVRMKKIIKEIERFCSFSFNEKSQKLRSIEQILVHNRQHYLNMNRRKNCLLEILNVITEGKNV